MDVASDEDIARGFAHLKTRWDAFDILVHAVAFAPREALTGTFIEATTREGFRVAHDISSYSLTALARASLPFMQGRAGAIVTLSYLGAMRSFPGYNVMGLAKASLEANVRFLAADLGPHGHPRQRGLGRPDQDALRRGHSRTCARCWRTSPPSRRSSATSPSRMSGNTAAFLCSDLAAGITGEVTYVDGGFNSVAMSFPGGVRRTHDVEARVRLVSTRAAALLRRVGRGNGICLQDSAQCALEGEIMLKTSE